MVGSFQNFVKVKLILTNFFKIICFFRHLALVHNMLDELLQDQDLIERKTNEALSKPKKISIGSTCPVCLQAIQKRDSRVHVIWHFMEELREMVHQFSDPKICDFCPYTNGNPDKMAKHMALGKKHALKKYD